MRLTATLLALLLGACADKSPPLQNFCELYTRTLPEADEVAALRRPTKEAILGNERIYLRECASRPLGGGPR
jgi:hypothetical protein